MSTDDLLHDWTVGVVARDVQRQIQTLLAIAVACPHEARRSHRLLKKGLTSPEPAVRLGGLVALRYLENFPCAVVENMAKADPEPTVRTEAARWLASQD